MTNKETSMRVGNRHAIQSPTAQPPRHHKPSEPGADTSTRPSRRRGRSPNWRAFKTPREHSQRGRPTALRVHSFWVSHQYLFSIDRRFHQY